MKCHAKMITQSTLSKDENKTRIQDAWKYSTSKIETESKTGNMNEVSRLNYFES